MSLTCTNVGADLTLACGSLPVAGLDSYVYLINKSQISAFTEASDIISAITLTSGGSKAWKWTGGNDFINGTYEAIEGRLATQFRHTITLIMPEDSQAALSEINNAANARFVAIVAKNAADGTYTFRVYGKSVGLKLTALTGDESNADTEGLPEVTFSTPENLKEPKTPQHFYDGSAYSSTSTLLEGYRTATA